MGRKRLKLFFRKMMSPAEKNLKGIINRKHMPEIDVLNLPLPELSWVDENGRPYVRSCNALMRHVGWSLGIYGRISIVTVGNVYEYFKHMANTEGRVSIRNYGTRSHEVTRRVFSNVGIDLPEVLIL